jgi:hypothetical protein
MCHNVYNVAMSNLVNETIPLWKVTTAPKHSKDWLIGYKFGKADAAVGLRDPLVHVANLLKTRQDDKAI